MRNKIITQDLQNIVAAHLPWSNFFGKTILITGGSGFIAAYIIETLLYLNELKKGSAMQVVCLVRNKEKALKRFLHYKGREDLKFMVQDVCRPVTYKKKVDFIIHAASFATPTKYGVDPVGTLLPNVLGTYHLLEFARNQNISGFLFISSGEVYGSPSARMKQMNETYFGSVDSMSLRSCYGESKRMGETMCVSWFHQYNVPTKIVRLFHTYGPEMPLGDGRVHSDFVRNITQNENIVMKSEGKTMRSFCYLADTTLGILTVLLKGDIGQAYNVGGDSVVSVLQLAQILVHLYPKKKLRVVRQMSDRGKTYLESSIKNNRPDVSKLHTLGWKQSYSLENGLRRTIVSFKY